MQSATDERAIDTIAVQLTALQRIRNSALGARTDDGLDPAAFAALFRLLTDGPMRSGALAELLRSDASTISRQVAQLVERDLVQRQADPADGRATVLVVTDCGRRLAERIHEHRRENLTQVMAEWTAPDRTVFAELLRKFVEDFERAGPHMVAAMRRLNLDRTENES
ncbi:MarR family winged helix-turn-helix transcriptional regulator [Nocardia australiensis]|uniref:MarR family winged helix-turn-helix transcriptional regulator n=1 Tax=Nocardia australiensis TaxID=2887191 RepID=UPI001D148645|nr:MarR family transcriptional regulator [Nocardia australiensis]